MRQGPGVSKEKLGESSGEASVVAEAPRIEEVIGRSRCLALCGRARVPEENPVEASDKDAVQMH